MYQSVLISPERHEIEHIAQCKGKGDPCQLCSDPDLIFFTFFQVCQRGDNQIVYPGHQVFGLIKGLCHHRFVFFPGSVNRIFLFQGIEFDRGLNIKIGYSFVQPGSPVLYNDTRNEKGVRIPFSIFWMIFGKTHFPPQNKGAGHPLCWPV